ncbi:MAG: electron transfer flavoprotein subunit alpha/FixB family protein [Tissierellales bacterium]|nr:electron transfer flavoprotein subunit alpha/FixB family protein [Tissierellales bacterium]
MRIIGIIDGFSPEYIRHILQLNTFRKHYMDAYTFTFWLIVNELFIENLQWLNELQIPYRLLLSQTGYLPEEYLSLIMNALEDEKPDILLLPGTDLGNELSVRLAYKLDGSSSSKVDYVETDYDSLIVTRPVYSSYLKGEFILHKKPWCLSINKGYEIEGRVPEIMSPIHSNIMNSNSVPPSFEWIVSSKQKMIVRKADLANADKLLVFGQGIGNREKLEHFSLRAKKLGFETGVSRPVALNAWSSMENLVGISGIICKPKVCLLAGVSGSSALTAGIEKSDLIVAINHDSKAAIFKIADIGVVDDYEDVLEELLNLMSQDDKN